MVAEKVKIENELETTKQNSQQMESQVKVLEVFFLLFLCFF